MNSYLISVPLGDPAPAGVRHSAHTQDYNTGTEDRSLWDCINLTDPTPAGAYLIGAWDMDSGEKLVEVHPDYYIVRPLGNEEAGQATPPLLFHYWDTAGMRGRQLGDAAAENPLLRLYPASVQPVLIAVRHKYFGGNANPAWDGYGWRAETSPYVPARDMTARAIGIYRDAACTDYWYTTGAFTLQDSEWQTDDEGNQVQVYATEYNPAFLTGVGEPDPTTQHHALLLGAAQEGYETLESSEEEDAYLYWDRIQGAEASPTSEWVDTGVTTTRLYGAGVYGVSDSSELIVGEAFRINGIECLYERQHSANIIVVVPHCGNDVGGAIERLV